jgi:hypothetical protein
LRFHAYLDMKQRGTGIPLLRSFCMNAVCSS